MVAILGDDRAFIVKAVKEMYSDVAKNPGKEFHFPTGRSACEFVGYPDSELNQLPETAIESFAGVGYPHKSNFIGEGHVVLDIGSGSGTDALIAGLRTGPAGKVYGLDMTKAMSDKLRENINKMDVSHVEPLEGHADEIPLADETVDVVTSNGVLNLVLDKQKAFNEIFRVLKPGGKVQIADIVVGSPISDKCKEDPALWAECVVGAALEDQYIEMFRNAGFADVKALHRFDYFEGSSSANTRKVAGEFQAHTVELVMTKA